MWQAAGGRRQVAGGRWQVAGGRRQFGGIAEFKPVPAELKAVIDAYTGQLSELGNIGTPTILSRKHGHWTSSYGMPKDLKAMIAGLLD
jgi:hypothetical protein